jgi:hypothetical protein
MEKLKQEKAELSKGVENDIGGLLYALPDKQQQRIADAVTEGRKVGAVIYASDEGTHERRIAYRPSATTMTEWFAAWREKVVPSFLPFVDGPLRALAAFEGDARLEKVRGLQGQIQELTNKEELLFTDRRNTNAAFIERFLAPDSAPSALGESLDALHFADDVDKGALREKVRKLADLRGKISIALADVEAEQYRQYEQSNFARLLLSPDA